MSQIEPSAAATGKDAGLASSTGDARMPRLLLLSPDFPPQRGGIQLLAHRLAGGLQAFETRVVTLDAPGAEGFDASAGLSTRRVRGPDAPRQARVAALNAAAVREAMRFRPAVTLSAHIVTSPAAAAIRRLLGAPTVQYFYAKEITDKPRIAAFAARQAQASISISGYTSELLAAAGAPLVDLHVIAPGVDLPDDADPLPSSRPTFLTIARLADRYKGHDVLVRSLAIVREQVPDVEWVIVGDGPLRRELEALARAEGVADAVRFLGAVSDQERDTWLRRCDLLAMPSRLPEDGKAGDGFGIAYLEAAVYGKPVVAGNVGGPLDAVVDGEGGLLVDPTDPIAVADAITTLLRDTQLARRLGHNAARRARGFSWPLVAARVQTLLLGQLAEGRPQRAPRSRTGDGA
ncbi:MAG TPA: glycosyltransferase family 4 protein [Solirubrobacteraceae bacterium]|nr:glycosyltransferase family 4 protein [Solirubrobacteraceae bacterium]